VGTGIYKQLIMRVMKMSVCEYRHMSAVHNESSEREGL
jgi:hypothetical protein